MNSTKRIIITLLFLTIFIVKNNPAIAKENNHSVKRLSSKQAESFEYAVKIAFVTNFARYTRWVDSSEKNIVLYTTSYRKLKPIFDKQKNKIVNGRKLKLRALGSRTKIPDGCIVFITKDIETKMVALILEKTANRPILTIGEGAGMAEKGCLINLLLIKQKIRFEVNLVAVKKSGLKLSSELLKLAKIIKPKEDR